MQKLASAARHSPSKWHCQTHGGDNPMHVDCPGFRCGWQPFV